jgi:hypothetical protein
MQPQRDNLLVYLGPITAIVLVVLGAWWYVGMLKQRVRDKPLAPVVEPWRPNASPYPNPRGAGSEQRP